MQRRDPEDAAARLRSAAATPSFLPSPTPETPGKRRAPKRKRLGRRSSAASVGSANGVASMPLAVDERTAAEQALEQDTWDLIDAGLVDAHRSSRRERKALERERDSLLDGLWDPFAGARTNPSMTTAPTAVPTGVPIGESTQPAHRQAGPVDLLVEVETLPDFDFKSAREATLPDLRFDQATEPGPVAFVAPAVADGELLLDTTLDHPGTEPARDVEPRDDRVVGTQLPWRRPRKRRTLLTASLLTLSIPSAALALFLALGSVLPWVRLGSGNQALDAIDQKSAIEPHLVGSTGPTPAEQAVRSILGVTLTGSGGLNGWQRRTQEGVTSVSLAFGCDPKDGLSPAVAGSVAYVSDGGNGASSLTVTARAYPAGAGSAALDGITQAAYACSGASVEQPSLNLGAEGIDIVSARSRSYLWRRGDVVLALTSEQGGAAGPIATYASAAQRLDDEMKQALADACADPDGGSSVAAAVARSPYLKRGGYRGFFEGVTVHPTVPESKSAENQAGQQGVDVVDIPDAEPILPDAGAVPAPPSPLPTRGPTAVPTPVASPTPPSIPTEPGLSADVPRQIEDTVGPGCGWAFTAQVAPRFNEARANAAFDADVNTTVAQLNRRWKAWQDAKLAFYSAWSRYTAQVGPYRMYASELAAVRAAWAAVEAARDAYFAALDAWEGQVDYIDQWTAAHDRAQTAYDAALAACAAQPSPSPSATPTPSTSPSPSATPTRAPTRAPTSVPGASMQRVACPPIAPPILSEPTPTVGASPVPADAAQLPPS